MCVSFDRRFIVQFSSLSAVTRPLSSELKLQEVSPSTACVEAELKKDGLNLRRLWETSLSVNV